MGADTERIKKRAPTLYAIIVLKIVKGLLFVGLAVTLYTLSDNNLPDEFRSLLQHLKLNPERRFFADLAIQVGQLTEKRVVLAAVGTLVYSLFSLVEGTGLMFRVSWAGWMAIGESAFFIPIEVYEILNRLKNPERHNPPSILVAILGLNVLIVWYLFQNRHRLFRHRHQ
jgi:uncharacterized membrane protein (DUF2068 family)